MSAVYNADEGVVGYTLLC